MGRRQAHGAVHPDLAEAFVDRVHHGVQDDEGGYDHGDEQVAQARQGAQGHGAEHGDLAADGRHHGDAQALHETFGPVDGGLIIRGKTHRYGPEGAAEVVHEGLWRQDEIRGRHVFEPRHLDRFLVVVHEREFREQVVARRRVVHGRERLAVQVRNAFHDGRVEHADHLVGLAEDHDLRPSRVLLRHAQQFGHIRRDDAHVPFTRGEPPARRQRPVQSAHPAFLRQQAQEGRRIGGPRRAVLPGPVDPHVRLVAGEVPRVPRPRDDGDAPVFGFRGSEFRQHVFVRLLLQRGPVWIPHEEPRVVRLRVLADLLQPEEGLHGREREHGEYQEHERGAGEQRPGLALAHVTDTEGEGRGQGARTPHVGGLHRTGVLPDLAHGLGEPARNEPDDHGGQGEGDEGEQHDIGRGGDLEGRMGEAQQSVGRHEDGEGGGDALVHVGESEDQPLQGVGEGDHQHHVEQHALHDVVGRPGRIGIGPRLVSPGGPGVLDEAVPLQVLPGRLRQVQQPARLPVEVVQPGIAHADGLERADPRLVQVPHVLRDLVGRQRNGADPRVEPDALRVLRVRVGQDQAAAEEAGRHGELEPALRRHEDNGRVFLVGKPRGPPSFLERHAPFQGRIARFVQYHGLVEPRQEARVHQVVEVRGLGPEDHRGLLLVHPVHRDLERVGAFPVRPPVRRVDDLPRLGVHHVAFRGVGPARFQFGAFGHAGAVGHHEDLVLHPADGLVVAAEPDHGAGLRLARDVILPGVELHDPDPAVHEAVLELHLEVGEQPGVVDPSAEQLGQQDGLRVHVAEVHPVEIVDGRVHEFAHVEHRGEGQGRQSHPEDQFGVQGDVARGKEPGGPMALRRRDHVHQGAGREGAPADDLVRVAHEGPSEWGEEPLLLEGIAAEEDAGVDHPDLVPGAGKVDAREELDVDGVFEAVREVTGNARVAVGEVVYPGERHEMTRRRQDQHRAGGGMGGEVPGHFQERGHARRLVRAR